MKRLLLLFALLMICGSPVARAANSCNVVATGYPGTPGYCKYIATSTTGTYNVATASGFIISASSDGGLTWRTLTSHTGVHDDPVSCAWAASGTLTVKVGDVVTLAIGICVYHGPETPAGPGPVINYQDGSIQGGDA